MIMSKVRTKLELIADNCTLNMEIAIQIMKIKSLELEVDLLKREKESNEENKNQR